jgi:uncharacterized protein YoxC
MSKEDKDKVSEDKPNLDPEAVGEQLRKEGFLGNPSKGGANGNAGAQKAKGKFSIPKGPGKNNTAIMVVLTAVISLVLTIVVVTFMCPSKSQVTNVSNKCTELSTEVQANASILSKVSSNLQDTITSLNTTVITLKGLQTSVGGIQTSVSGLQSNVASLQASSYNSNTQFTVGGNTSYNVSGNSSIGYTGNLSAILNLVYNESTSPGPVTPIVPAEPVLISPLAVANHSVCILQWSYTGTLNNTWFQVYLSSSTDSWVFNTSSTSYIIPTGLLTVSTPYTWWISATGTDGIDNTSTVGQFTTY